MVSHPNESEQGKIAFGMRGFEYCLLRVELLLCHCQDSQPFGCHVVSSTLPARDLKRTLRRPFVAATIKHCLGASPSCRSVRVRRWCNVMWPWTVTRR